MRAVLQREEIQRRIQGIDGLPAMPDSLEEIWRVLRDPNCRARDLAGAIARDPGITARLLRMTNSAYYSLNRSVSDVGEAIVVLGFEVVKSMAIGASVVDTFRDRLPGFDMEGFWHHGVEVAVVSESVARMSGQVRPEVAFCGGILHDIGRLALAAALGPQGCDDGGDSGGESRDSGEGHGLEGREPDGGPIEPDVDHQTAGVWLGRKWKFSSELLDVIGYHHDPEHAGESRRLVSTVALAESLVPSLRRLEAGEPAATWNGACAEYLGVKDEELRALIACLPEKLKAAAPMMGFCQ